MRIWFIYNWFIETSLFPVISRVQNKHSFASVQDFETLANTHLLKEILFAVMLYISNNFN